MSRERDTGLVLVDQSTDPTLPPLMREKFAFGVRGLPYSATYRLTRILGFHTAYIGTSHFSSLVDIVLGGLRFAVNNRLRPDRLPVAKTLLSQLAPLCIRTPVGQVSELSVCFRPKQVRAPTYASTYDALRAFLAEGGIEVE